MTIHLESRDALSRSLVLKQGNIRNSVNLHNKKSMAWYGMSSLRLIHHFYVIFSTFEDLCFLSLNTLRGDGRIDLPIY